MNHHATTEGNHNIIIQGVTDSTITLNVNGATQEIKKKLDTLLGLLQQQKTFQVADKIYNIGSISNANFDFVLEQSNQANVLPQELADNLIMESSCCEKFPTSHVYSAVSEPLICYAVWKPLNADLKLETSNNNFYFTFFCIATYSSSALPSPSQSRRVENSHCLSPTHNLY
ncbi:MAG: hypothetical protein RLZZ292_2857 [Bacteroidota bacterium]